MKSKVLSSILLLVLVSINPLFAQEQRSSISLEEFEAKLNQTSHPQILDVRSPEEFEENHLKHATNLNLKDEASANQKIATLDKQKPVFVYSINNGRSGIVSKQLREQGFKEVYELPGGIAHWIGAGNPIETKLGKGISLKEFEQQVVSNNIVLVDVGSKYCGGCKKLAPIVDEVGREQASSLKVYKIELYDNRVLANTLNIESVPTLILYKGGKPVWTKSGSISKTEIQDAISKASSTPACEGADELMKKRSSQTVNN